MVCCQCEGIESAFSEKRAARQLKNYRKKGAARTTRMLVDLIKAQGVAGLTLLDIGGGVGAIPHLLFEAGIAHATCVEASSAYLKTAREEAERRGLVSQIDFYHGDFVALAPQLEPADIVTLDRVICCYHDMESLVGLSAARAKKWYGLVYPRDTWWVKLARPVGNFFFWLRRNPFRIFVHATSDVDAVVAREGLRKIEHRQTLIWQIVLYGRED